jgi:sec-independent protein translocase protein TatA
MEIAIVAIIALVIFGPRKLPELGSSLGKGMREFKSSITGEDGQQPVQVENRVEEPAAEDGEPTPAAAARS